MKKKLILVGGGGHCKSCIDVIDQLDTFEIEGILDVAEKVGQTIMGYPIIGTDDMIDSYAEKGFSFLITVGQVRNPEPRVRLFKRLDALNADMPVIIAPNAHVSPHSKIGKGTVILNYALVNGDTEIGVNCILNTRALVEHDSKVGDHCHISTGAILNGAVIVGERTFMGSGSVSREQVVIPPGSFIKAQSVVK
jgi:sugar O-acyltransferase (sialic acid O-acetyltransferase NeuD family)